MMQWTSDKTLQNLIPFFFSSSVSCIVISYFWGLLFHYTLVLSIIILLSLLQVFSFLSLQTANHSLQLLLYILFTGIIDPRHSPFS